MSRLLSQQVTQSNHFIGKLDTVKDISLLLKAIHFKEVNLFIYLLVPLYSTCL